MDKKKINRLWPEYLNKRLYKYSWLRQLQSNIIFLTAQAANRIFFNKKQTTFNFRQQLRQRVVCTFGNINFKSLTPGFNKRL